MTTVDPNWKDGTLLKERIQAEIAKNGPLCSLNHIDVSDVENMDCLFELSNFNGDISEWNVSKVKSMRRMFMRSLFDGDISRWNTSKVREMDMMFSLSKFTGDISQWNVARVKEMQAMFEGSTFRGDISGWNVSKARNLQSMFAYSLFAGNVSKWNIHPEALTGGMFTACPMQNDCPKINVATMLSPIVDKTYRGNFNNQYNLEEATKLFGKSQFIEAYLRETAKVRPLDRLHFEKTLEFRGKPGWLEKDTYKWIKTQQSVLESLGMASDDIGLWMLQNHGKTSTPIETYALGDLVLD